MSNKKRRPRLVTIPEFLQAHPEYTENQIRWGLRNRAENGFPQLYKRHASKGFVMFDAELLAWLTQPVTA